jgi:serine/threonine-protein kinase
MLNRGGMGAVYLASRDDDPDALFAVKVILKEIVTAQFLARFDRERSLLAQLSHPNIVQIAGIGETADGVPYLAMEYVEGEPITSYCEERGLPAAARIREFLDVCAAVQYLHEHGFVHRDLKPSNIFVTRDGKVKLLDFGIAKSMTDASKSLSMGLKLYTPAFASPEQMKGLAARPSSDIYSLGVILYYLLTGRLPFPEEPGLSPTNRIERMFTQAPPAVGVPALDAVVTRALRGELHERYLMARDISLDLQAYLAGGSPSGGADG